MDERKFWVHHLWSDLLAIPQSQDIEARRFNRNVFLLMAIWLAKYQNAFGESLSGSLREDIDELVLHYEQRTKASLLPLAKSIQRQLFVDLGIPETGLVDLNGSVLSAMLDILRWRLAEVDDPFYLADVAFHRSIERPRVVGRGLTEAVIELAGVLLPLAPHLVDYFLETGDLAVRTARRKRSAAMRIKPIEVRTARITSDESLVKLRLALNEVSVSLDDDDPAFRQWYDSLVVIAHPRHRSGGRRTAGRHGSPAEVSYDPSALQALANTIGHAVFRLAIVAVPARDATASSGWRRDLRQRLVQSGKVLAVIGGVASPRSASNQDAIWLVSDDSRPVDEVLFINAWNLGKEENADLSDVMHFVVRTVGLLPDRNPLYHMDFGPDEPEKLRGRFSRAFRDGYRDVPGLCRLVSAAEIDAKNWSLTASDYVSHIQGDKAPLQLDGEPVMDLLKKPFPVRAYVIGTNGQGKSLLLAQLADELAQLGMASAGLSFGLTDRFNFRPDGQMSDRFLYLGARTSESGINLRPTKQRLEDNIRTIRASSHRLQAFRSALKTLGFGHRIYLIPSSIKLLNGTIPDKALGKVEELTASGTDQEAVPGMTSFALGIIRSDAGNRVVLFERLSSGEQQLITLAAKLSAQAEKHMVMLVDEPELSLHVRWQLAIPPMLADLSENLECSLVVATHSPVLIASTLERDHCFVASKQVLTPLEPHQRKSVESVLFDDFDTYTTNTRRVHELCAALVSETIHEVNGDTRARRKQRAPLERLKDIGRVVEAAPGQQTAGRQRDLALIERTRAAIEELLAQMRTDPSGSERAP